MALVALVVVDGALVERPVSVLVERLVREVTERSKLSSITIWHDKNTPEHNWLMSSTELGRTNPRTEERENH